MKFGRMIPEVYAYFSNIKQHEIMGYLRSKGDEYVSHVDTDDLTDYLYHQYALPIIEIDPNKNVEIKRQSGMVTGNMHGRSYRTEQNQIKCTWFFLHQHNLRHSLALRPYSHVDYTLEIEFNEEFSSMTFIVPTNDFDYVMNFLKDEIHTKNDEITRENNVLRSTIHQLITHRKQIINEYKDQYERAIENVNIPLKRIDISETPLVDLRVRKSIQALREPIVTPQKEFTLERQHVLDILEVIQRGGMEFELSPEVYSKLDEPDLRSILLSHLNVVFEGNATGETFSKLGKTDIHLKISQGQIFIVECKFWNGLKAYREDHIDQLFRYLTWRRNYAAIVTFSKNKGFSNVLSSLEQAIREHPTYREQFEKISKTHFQSKHVFPEDDKKEIEIHHLVFDLHSAR